jgi:steroid delta-isomerase-like uncharacterized protein
MMAPEWKEARMPDADVVRIARENVDAWTAGDWNRLRAALAADVVYDEIGTQRRLVGVNDFIQSYQAWKRAGPDGKGTVTRALASGDTVLIEVAWSATQTGPIETPKGPIPPSGKKWNVRGAQVITVKDGKIQELRQYFDMLTILSR